MTPYLTFVMVSRNDGYGGNLLQMSVGAMLALWEKYSLDAELVIVDWNPPESSPRLKDILTWPENLKPGTLRFIEVPREIHLRLPNSDKMPIFEYIGKNVGIRRARGNYILATNQDLLYSEELIKFLASRTLSPECFYRVDRYDVGSTLPLPKDVQDWLTFCVKHVSRVNVRGGTIELRRPPIGLGDVCFRLRLFIHRLSSYSRRRIEDRLHTNASGDFILMAREHWFNLRGFPELPTTAHIDSYMCVMAASAGLRQVILPTWMRVYHLEHKRAVDWRDPGKSSRPVTSYHAWVQQSKEMLRLRKPMTFNEENWGLGDTILEEYQSQGNCARAAKSEMHLR